MSDPAADEVTAYLYQRDGTLIRTVQIPRRFVAPQLLVLTDGLSGSTTMSYYLRTSPDGTADPLEYELISGSSVYIGASLPLDETGGE